MEPARRSRCNTGEMKRALALAVFVAGILVGSAGGAGPSPGTAFGSPGVVSHDGKVRYVALRAGRGTLVEAISTRDGTVRRTRFLKGLYGVPLVAYDGSTGGLARNGKRLVVYSAGSATRYVVLDPRSLRVQSRIVLQGSFGFDALSPDGSLMYLIHLKRSAGIDYEVRALDLTSGRLFPGAIVDRREPDEKMTGLPMTRVGSDDASWAYTLYSRDNASPFVHALHTTAREAFCIDVPLSLSGEELSHVRMRLRGGSLLLRFRGHTVATVDTRTFEVKR
jgi:hypothetical protein